MRRLVLCFDGTWNKPENQTNVWRMYSAVADARSGCDLQVKYYDSGVGTESGNKVRGGAFGRGLDDNVLDAYCWLVQNFEPAGTKDFHGRTFAEGDEIWLFGFSRGAYTARSLGGLIGRCGLLRKELFEDKRTPGTLLSDIVVRSHERVRAAWQMYRRPGDQVLTGDGEPLPELAAFREQNSRLVTIRFIGVWDTVGALGVPTTLKLGPINLNQRYEFHDTNLGFGVEAAYHALAIDENRRDYEATLWTRWRSFQDVEQRWFPGAHANVGGGYEDDLLFAAPLEWMAGKALAHGLQMVLEPGGAVGTGMPLAFRLRGDEYLAPVRDSYREFGYGLYSLVSRRYHRPMLTDGVKEFIDACAERKWSAEPGYRPPNFAMAGRGDVNVARATPHDEQPAGGT